MAAPPSALQQAINNASRKYGVPAATLTGIWEIESGSSYPNRYVNSSGYGGLFGTTDWNGPPQEQANLAASILSRLLRKNNGNMALALSEYSGGGYSSVPGGANGVPIPAAAPTDLGGASSITAQPAGGHATGGSGSGGFWGSIEGAAGEVVGGVEGAAGSLVKSAEDLINGPVDFFKAMVWLVNPLTWLRGVEGLFGFVLMLGGVAIMLGADRALKSVPGPTGAAAALAAEA